MGALATTAHVRVHDDPAGGDFARADRAVATTVGTDIASRPACSGPAPGG
jgi:hypothetical protein